MNDFESELTQFWCVISYKFTLYKSTREFNNPIWLKV